MTSYDDKIDKAGKTGDFNYSGYFDWPELYETMAKWTNKKQYRIYEHLYKDKTNKAGITEREIFWYMDRKVDNMHKYILNLKIKMWDCQKVEVTKNGKTRTIDRGRFRIRIDAEVDKDFQKLFGQSKFWEKMWGIYTKITQWNYAFEHWDTVYNDMYDFLADIKTFLDLDIKQ